MKTKKSIYQLSPEFLSALYLLTSCTKLWSKARHAVELQRIDFTKIFLKNTNPDCYTLLKAAQDIYEGTNHVDFLDLTDSVNISEKIYKLIINAVDINRSGSCAFKLNKKGVII
jgi:hypothetical protein